MLTAHLMPRETEEVLGALSGGFGRGSESVLAKRRIPRQER